MKLEKNRIYKHFKGDCYLVLDTAINYEIVDKAGAWITYNKNKIGQGRENAKQFLKDNPKLIQ